MPDLRLALTAAFGEPKVTQLEAMCLCPSCPSYPAEDFGEKQMYCLRGDSPHEASIDPVNCLCESCEVYKHSKLYGSNYFCLEGAATAKGARNMLKGDLISALVDMKESQHPSIVITQGLDVHERRYEEGGRGPG